MVSCAILLVLAYKEFLQKESGSHTVPRYLPLTIVLAYLSPKLMVVVPECRGVSSFPTSSDVLRIGVFDLLHSNKIMKSVK